ncbi:MAG: HlyD family efflux transporter periplasmic adaptor subunit [Clostridia bacterium]|nr:HlyD family efflux transporter periplasmic adaptor subunit [Clostridia bacterium]
MELYSNHKLNNNLLRKIKTKPVIIGVICFILITAIIVALVLRFGSVKTAAIEQRTEKVVKGSISVSVTGSGPVKSSNESEVTSAVSGKITKIYHKEGDTVKAGELLFDLDDSDARLNVEKIKNSIAQTRLTADSNEKGMNNLIVNAPFDGQVTNVTFSKVGDEINKGATVLTITDVSKLKLSASFSGAIIQEIKTGQKVIVNVQDLMQSVEGIVTYISKNPSTTSTGGAVYDAEITLSNPGSLKAGMGANVEVETKTGSHTSTGTGKLEYVNSQVIKCDSGGVIEKITVKENQFVSAGQSLIQFRNDDLELSVQTTGLKIQDLNNQLAAAEKQLSEYKIYSPIDGVIVLQDIKVGNSVKPADVLTTITDPGHMEFSVSIDELDIAKIKVGQKVNITIAALPETLLKPIGGQVSKIAIQGTSSNGVTTYPVTIKVNEAADLKVGMNADAEIMISEKTDILVVPLEAVQKMRNRSFVMVKEKEGNSADGAVEKSTDAISDGNRIRRNNSGNNSNGNGGGRRNSSDSASTGTNSGNFAAGISRMNPAYAQYYSNAVMKPVEVGTNNDQYIEIVSGLNEGDEVILPPLANSSSQNNMQVRSNIGGIGGMGGLGGGFGGNPERNRNNTQSNNSSGERK